MGGGYSGKFTGTEGAIGENKYHQLSLSDELPVRTKAIIEGDGKIGIGIGGGVPTAKLKQCHCCGEYVIQLGIENEICPICGWIDDKFQNTHPDSLDGRNTISLNSAREQYFNKKM